MRTAKRQEIAPACNTARKRSRNAAPASTVRQHYLEPEDFEIVEPEDAAAMEPYLRGCWCSAETNLDPEDSN